MAKHHKEETEVIGFVESPEEFIHSIVENEEEKSWVADEVIYGGPRHKQAYSALLLQGASALIKAVEKETCKTFSVQKGVTLTSKEDWQIPVPLVLSSVKTQHQQEAEEVLSHAPAHEIIAFNALLQAIEWSISSLTKSGPQD